MRIPSCLLRIAAVVSERAEESLWVRSLETSKLINIRNIDSKWNVIRPSGCSHPPPMSMRTCTPSVVSNSGDSRTHHSPTTSSSTAGLEDRISFLHHSWRDQRQTPSAVPAERSASTYPAEPAHHVAIREKPPLPPKHAWLTNRPKRETPPPAGLAATHCVSLSAEPSETRQPATHGLAELLREALSQRVGDESFQEYQQRVHGTTLATPLAPLVPKATLSSAASGLLEEIRAMQPLLKKVPEPIGRPSGTGTSTTDVFTRAFDELDVEKVIDVRRPSRDSGVGCDEAEWQDLQ